MRAYLIRVGIDKTSGGWNAPVNTDTNEFVYIPIPESRPMQPELATPYKWIRPALARFAAANPTAAPQDVRLPRTLARRNMHLDPDFEHLTYGDNGRRRGKGLTQLRDGDVLVFFSGLKPIAPSERLVYALIGFYRVDRAVLVESVSACRWGENAHTRRTTRESSDVIVGAKSGGSGRLRRCIPIGEFRDFSYRVERALLSEWGGLSCHDGYLQRSAVLPSFREPRRFMRWFDRQQPELVSCNNP